VRLLGGESDDETLAEISGDVEARNHRPLLRAIVEPDTIAQ
jgi:hypothetical protein